MILNLPQFKNILFILFFAFSVGIVFSQTTIKSQSFDGGVSVYSDDLNYTVSNGTYAYVGSSTYESSPNSLHFTNTVSDTNNESFLYFDNIDITAYSGVSVTISFASENANKKRDLYLGISYDNGSNYTNTKLIKGDNAGGGQDLAWGVADNSGGTVTTNAYTISIPDTESNVKIRVKAKKLESGEFFYIDNVIIKGTLIVNQGTPQIDFDGVDDYVDFGDNHDLTGDFSIEAWILQDNNGGTKTIISKGDLYSSNGSKNYGYTLTVEGGYPCFKTYSNGGAIKIDVISPYNLDLNKWYHIAVTYNGPTSTTKLYVDGLFVDDHSSSSSITNRSESCYIGAYFDSDSGQVNYFNGSIDEIRIWDVTLSETQIHEMMNQEIDQNGTAVQGKVIPRDISDGLLWSNLIGYYDMNTDDAIDGSDSLIHGTPKNITTSQAQTAPLPYMTIRDGNWDNVTAATPWLYGDSVWNLPNSLGIDNSTMIDWNIVKTSHNVDVDRSLYLLGMISESTALVNDEEITDSEVTIGSNGGSYELNISHYLKLDGKIDLQNESQLIQGEGSWLDVDSSGYVEKDQQGTANSYTYNYWSSPVSLRNTAENNKAYKTGDVLRDGCLENDVVRSFDFDPDTTSSVDPYYADGNATDPRKLATYWMWKFVLGASNAVTGWEWVGNYSNINVTEGFTMKGTSGTGNIDMSQEFQNYVFRGKPNNVLNGETELVHTTFTASFDSSGNPKYTLTGNPFLSAIDANAFIDDNSNTIEGQLYFWEHWGGGSHQYKKYQGGYSIYTKAGGTAAVSDSNGSQTGSGSKVPQRYIPIGQGFYVTQKHDYDSDTQVYSNPQAGNVVFKNSQRKFITEESGQSLFTKGSNTKSKGASKEGVYTSTPDGIQRIRLGFEASDGFYRPLMVAFLEGATDDFDDGYDGVAGDFLKNDAFFYQNNKYLVIQAFGEFDSNREIPFSVFVNEEGQGGVQKFKIESIENFGENINVYIKDNFNNGETYELTNSTFEIDLEPGEHKNRFSLVFQSQVLAIDELPGLEEGFKIFMNNDQKLLNIKNLINLDLQRVTLFNSVGQAMYSWNNNLENTNIVLPIDVSTGVYIVLLKTKKAMYSKKVLIE